MKLGKILGIKDSPHTPKESTMFVSNRRVGVELEYENITSHPSDSLDLNLWEVVEDGSLRIINDDTYSLELRYRGALGGYDSERALASLNKFLVRNKDIMCTERTGLHVHIDFRDVNNLQLRNFLINYLIAEPFLYEYCGNDRNNNIFCLPLYKTPHLIYDHLSSYRFSCPKDLGYYISKMYKYSGMNILSIQKKGSVEFRMHHATTSVEEVITWINILLSLVENSLHENINVKKLSKNLTFNYIKKLFGKYSNLFMTNNLDRNLGTSSESLSTFICSTKKSKLVESVCSNKKEIVEVKEDKTEIYNPEISLDSIERILLNPASLTGRVRTGAQYLYGRDFSRNTTMDNSEDSSGPSSIDP